MLRIAKSLIVIVVVVAIVSGATGAAWTDSTTLDNNVFTTGYMDITTNPASALFTAGNIYPGWSETKSLVVQNSGTVPLNYDIVASKVAGDDILYTSTAFLLKIGTTSGAGDVYSGTVSGLTGLSSVRNLVASANETLYFTVSLDASAGNGLQTKTATVSFTFNATQP